MCARETVTETVGGIGTVCVSVRGVGEERAHPSHPIEGNSKKMCKLRIVKTQAF